MSTDHQDKPSVSRRDFLTGALLSAGMTGLLLVVWSENWSESIGCRVENV